MFTPNRDLLNPKFEGYKLDAVDQDELVFRFHLDHQATQSTVSNKYPLSFHEVQSRITHNHLTVCPHGSRAVYVDADYKLIAIDFPTASLTPSFKIVYELPKPIQTSPEHAIHNEYPSAVFLSSSILLVSDGHGMMYVFTDNGLLELLATYRLPSGNPFRLHSAQQPTENSAVLLLSARNYEKRSNSTRKVVEFDVLAATLPIPISANHETAVLNFQWQRSGQSVPVYSAFDLTRRSFLLIGGCVYQDNQTTAPAPYIPTPDEISPIPRQGENLDVPNTPPPYSWTQTADSVTVAFPLPSATSKSDIHVQFSTKYLTVIVSGESTRFPPLPKHDRKELWDLVSSSSSYWTWDQEGDHSYGLLTLYLDKQHEGTKWMHVFASSASGEETDVPETLDPSELWAIRESLEKYTAALRDGEDASGLGLGKGVPSLAEGEMDEVDASVGRSVYTTWVSEDGSRPSWFTPLEETPFQLLSTPVPGSVDQTDELSLIIKTDLDGTLFSLEGSSTLPSWVHTSTYSALAFVLASKQDTRFTHHIPSKAVVAFENGFRDRGANVYIYKATPVAKKWAKQAILKISDGSGGSLLGVGLVHVCGRNALLCLTEQELVIIKEF